MTVTEILQKPGRFNLKLRPDTPYGVRAAIAAFDHVVITPTRLRNASDLADATILARALYTGVITKFPTPFEIEGQGLEFWLGTDDGRGDLLDSLVSNTTGSLSTWCTSLRPSSLSAGTVTNTGTGTLTYGYQYMSRREAFDHMLRAVGAERRVNPNFTLDAALATTLFVSTPTAVITRKPEGTEGALTGIEATHANAAVDVDGYTTKAIVVGKAGDGAMVAVGSATGSNVYKDGLNNNVTLERFVNAPTTPAASISAYASSVLALYSSIRRTFTLSSRTYAAPLRVRPGDWAWVFDPEDGFVDIANQVQWRGEVTTPVKLRCKEMTWPVQSGMGVMARRSGATPTYLDLSDYVLWETSDTEWAFGATAGDPEQDPTQLGSAFLGVNPEIVARTAFASVLPDRDGSTDYSLVYRDGNVTKIYDSVAAADVLTLTSAKLLTVLDITASQFLRSTFATWNGAWSSAPIQADHWGANNTSLALHANTIGPQLTAVQGLGERFNIRNNSDTAYGSIAASAFTVASTIRIKDDVATVTDADLLARIAAVPLKNFRLKDRPQTLRLSAKFAAVAQRWKDTGRTPLVPKPNHLESHDHDCGIDGCAGTPDSPCCITANDTPRFGVIAEDLHAHAPEATVLDEGGIPAGYDVDQLAAMAFGGVGALLRRIVALEARIVALEATA
ncbi:MAG: hypothetical protein Q7V57_11295 [Actinomycetota bacterium]|nr:hypothetical protein [Actinomycetota bacterium]